MKISLRHLTPRILTLLVLPLLLLGCERDTVNMNETQDYMRTDGLTLDQKEGTAPKKALTNSPLQQL